MTNYSLKAYNKEHMARAYGSSLNISTKYAVEVSRMIRGKKVSRAKAMLAEYGGGGGGHKIAAGAYIPRTAEQEFVQRVNRILGEQFAAAGSGHR